MSNLALISSQAQKTLSIRATAKLIGLSHGVLNKVFLNDGSEASKLAESLLNKGFKTEDWRIIGVPIDAVIHIAHYYGFEAGKRKKPEALALWKFFQKNKTLDGFVFKPKSKYQRVTPERYVCDKLKNRLHLDNPKIEVKTPGGLIDLLTDTQIIEVKQVSGWKAAIGQVLVYSVYYPNHTKRVHLFGAIDSKMISIIQKHCDLLNIELTFE